MHGGTLFGCGFTIYMLRRYLGLLQLLHLILWSSCKSPRASWWLCAGAAMLQQMEEMLLLWQHNSLSLSLSCTTWFCSKKNILRFHQETSNPWEIHVLYPLSSYQLVYQGKKRIFLRNFTDLIKKNASGGEWTKECAQTLFLLSLKYPALMVTLSIVCPWHKATNNLLFWGNSEQNVMEPIRSQSNVPSE